MVPAHHCTPRRAIGDTRDVGLRRVAGLLAMAFGALRLQSGNGLRISLPELQQALSGQLIDNTFDLRAGTADTGKAPRPPPTDRIWPTRNVMRTLQRGSLCGSAYNAMFASCSLAMQLLFSDLAHCRSRNRIRASTCDVRHDAIGTALPLLPLSTSLPRSILRWHRHAQYASRPIAQLYAA
ncbi:hypothetical protein [Xanthomonas sp. 1678]|uniref:hypothetical protein n=1 Tax=Xanthomonas sp. 1678 TaxID=3158788 RepID=UPI0028566417|nr:hypothetical protein [Xanthomonas translucens]